MNPVFQATIQEGYVLHENSTKYLLHIKSLEGKRVDVTIKLHKSQRSNSQNSYYWSAVLPILGDYFGYDADDMHSALKYKFLRTGAADLETVKSTTKLTTAEFEEYLERVRRWAVTEYSVVVPLPNEVEA